MDGNIDNLIEAMEQLKIQHNPVKNWNHLSDSLKLKCINEMDFSSRTRLRSASKSDRFLVDLLRYPVSRLYIQLLREPTKSFEIHVESEKFDEIHVAYHKPSLWKFWKHYRDRSMFSKVLDFLKQLLARSKISICHVETRGLPCSDKIQNLILIYDAIVAGPELEIETLKFALDTSSRIKFAILNKCDVAFLKIEVDENGQNIPDISDFAKFSQVQTFERIDLRRKNGEFQLKAGYFRIEVAVRWVHRNSDMKISIDYSKTSNKISELKKFTKIRDLSHYDTEKALRIVPRRLKNRHIWIWIHPNNQKLYCFLLPETSSFSNFECLLVVGKEEELCENSHLDWVWLDEHNYCCLC